MADGRRRQHLSPLHYNPLEPLVVRVDAKCKSSSSNCCVEQPPSASTVRHRGAAAGRAWAQNFYALLRAAGSVRRVFSTWDIFFCTPSFLFLLFEIHRDTCNNEFIAPVPANQLFPGRCITRSLYGRFFTRVGRSRPARVGPPLRWPRPGHDVTAHAEAVRAVQQGAPTQRGKHCQELQGKSRYVITRHLMDAF